MEEDPGKTYPAAPVPDLENMEETFKRDQEMKDDAWLINTARGELVNAKAVVAALNAGKLAGYVTDVLDEEPPAADHPLLNHPKAIVTPHIGSRTYESVPRQAMRATTNLVNWYSGEGEVLQANKF